MTHTEIYRGHKVEVWRTDDPMEPPEDDPKAVGPFEIGDWYSKVSSIDFELTANVSTFDQALQIAKDKVDERMTAVKAKT